ncbi:glutathione s-transferase [Venturia nashicola]|uniref:Glutathione s-transferase n=1 Tax=Venturia nashicola TaxID=86259 RepID=A0A4Z1P419_9PEZI|nr:glutathione s-transferase [Venturia nashicola]
MPTTTTVGTSSAANQKLGGTPHIHYFDFFSRGRGQVIRLLCEDAGIAYIDTRYTFDEFPSQKDGKLGDMNPLKAVPVVELNGKILTQSYAILRSWSRQLGEYDGKTEEEKYFVDAVGDLGADWRTLFVIAFLSPNKDTAYPEHCKTDRVRYLSAIESHLKQSPLSQKGPFVLSDRITYADLVVYQVIHDEGLTKDERAGLRDYPRLKQLVNGVESRPGVKAFLGSDRYKG